MTEPKNAPDTSSLILNSPVARALAQVGDRWTCLILRDVFLGVRRFEEFRKRSGAARGTLTSRLKNMVANDLLDRVPYQQTPTRYEYRLTEKGLDLYPFMLAVWAWETRWSHETHIPPELSHVPCGNPMRPLFRCENCQTNIALGEVTYKPVQIDGMAAALPVRSRRRSKSSDISEAGVDRRFFHMLDIVGDRWTGLVIAAYYFGLNRFDDIAEALGVATNVLADRLKLLVSVNVLERIPYQEKPLRHEYKITEKGAALYNSTLQLHEWASKWLVSEIEFSLVLTHESCGQHLHSEVVCDQCTQPLKPNEVTFDAVDE